MSSLTSFCIHCETKCALKDLSSTEKFNFRISCSSCYLVYVMLLLFLLANLIRKEHSFQCLLRSVPGLVIIFSEKHDVYNASGQVTLELN